MKLYIIEGLDKTGKTTYMKDRFLDYSKIRLPGGYDFTQEMRRNFLEGRIEKPQMIHLIYGEHMAILEKLLQESSQNHVLDRSFISYLVYQEEELKRFGYYDTYKQLLEEKFQQIKKIYEVKILYFSKQLVERKDDWLEKMDSDQLKNRFEALLAQPIYSDSVERINILANHLNR